MLLSSSLFNSLKAGVQSLIAISDRALHLRVVWYLCTRLSCHLHPCTSWHKQKHWILILDNHKSHFSGKFQYLYLENNVHPLFLLAHSSHKFQSLDMDSFSPLAQKYSRALKLCTLTGLVIINRKVFIEIYNQIHPNSLSERAIQAGWKRAGLHSLNKQRILDDSDIKNFGHTTSEYLSPSLSEGPNGLFSTPKKFQNVQALISTLEAASTPSRQRGIKKLDHIALQELTAFKLLAEKI